MNPFESSFTLGLLDALFAVTVVAPAVVGYWRGTWNLMGHYVYTEDALRSSLVSLLIGFAGMFIFCLAQGPIKRALHGKPGYCFVLASWLYTIVYGFICVNSWRGAWLIGDLYKGRSVIFITAITSLAVFLLALLKALRNISAPPCVVTVDQKKDYFEVPTYFKKLSHQKTSLYILDCLFSVLVIGSLVVIVWRGVWVIVDDTVFPNDLSLSALASLVLGYGVVVITFILQPLMSLACARLQGIWRIVVADIFLFFSFIGTVNVWRSVWLFLDIYFLPEHRIASDWITHAGCLLLLLLLNCGNSVLVRGVYVDCEEPAGECVILPVHYLRLYCSKEKARRLRRGTVAEYRLKTEEEPGSVNITNRDIVESNNAQQALINTITAPVGFIITKNTGKIK